MSTLTREQIAWNAGRDAAIKCCEPHGDDDAMDKQAKAECAKAIAALQAPQFQPAPFMKTPNEAALEKSLQDALLHGTGMVMVHLPHDEVFTPAPPSDVVENKVWNEAIDAAELAAFEISSPESEEVINAILGPVADAIRALKRNPTK